MVVNSGTERAIEDMGLREGMVAMGHNGLEKVLAGETTIDEVLRVSGAE